jgi:hypothetical protein
MRELSFQEQRCVGGGELQVFDDGSSIETDSNGNVSYGYDSEGNMFWGNSCQAFADLVISFMDQNQMVRNADTAIGVFTYLFTTNTATLTSTIRLLINSGQCTPVDPFAGQSGG